MSIPGPATIVLLCTMFCIGKGVAAETLYQGWSVALNNNPQLAASELEEAASQFDLQATRSERLPSASLYSSYTLRSDSPHFRIPALGSSSFTLSQRDYGTAGAQLKAPLYTSGRIKNSILGAQANLAAAGHEVVATRMELMLAIGETYLSVLRVQRELEVAQQDLASLTANETEVKSLFEQDRVPRNDLLAAQVTTATAVQSRLREQHRLETTRAAYNRLLGRPLRTPFQLEELQLVWLQENLEQLEQIAWQRRPELHQLQSLADARYFESKRLHATQLPQVSAVGRYDFEENRYQSPEAISSTAVVIDWILFDGDRSRRAANAELTRAAGLGRRIQDHKSHISLALLTALNDRSEAAERREVALRALQHADENLRVSSLRYANGVAVNSEVLDAQSRRTQVARDYYNATYDITLSQLRLRFAAGILGLPE